METRAPPQKVLVKNMVKEGEMDKNRGKLAK